MRNMRIRSLKEAGNISTKELMEKYRPDLHKHLGGREYRHTCGLSVVRMQSAAFGGNESVGAGERVR